MTIEKFDPKGWKKALNLGNHPRTLTPEELAGMAADYLAEKRADGNDEVREKRKFEQQTLGVN